MAMRMQRRHGNARADHAGMHRAVTTRSETVSRGARVAVLLFTALLLGGGTRNYLFSDLLVQLLASVLLIYGLARLRWQDLDTGARQYLQLVALVLLLPLLQLLPLPTARWCRGFPGAENSGRGGRNSGWMSRRSCPGASIRMLRSRRCAALLPGCAMALLAYNWARSGKSVWC